MGALELYKNLSNPLTKRLQEGAENSGTQCKPKCKKNWKEVFLQQVKIENEFLSPSVHHTTHNSNFFGRMVLVPLTTVVTLVMN